MRELTLNFHEEPEVWDRFVAVSQQGSIFCTTPFLNSLGVNYDLVTVREGNTVVGGVPILRNADGSLCSQPFPLSMYQGFMLGFDPESKAHSRISKSLRVVDRLVTDLVEKYGNVSFSQHWRTEDVRAIQWYNFGGSPTQVFKIELGYSAVLDTTKFSSFEEYLQSIRSVRRQEWKKAQRDLEFSIDSDIAELDRLHELTFRRQGLTRSELESRVVSEIARSAIEGGYGQIGIASMGNKVVSACLFLWDGHTAYYLIGANDPEYRASGAGTFVLLSMISRAFDAGLSEVDFVGANSPNRGDYKVSFNASLRPCYSLSLPQQTVQHPGEGVAR